MPRGFFAASTGIATALGVVVALLMASQAGGEGMTLAAITGCVLAFGATCVVALIGPPLVTQDRFGMVVLGTSAIRVVLVLAAMILLTEAAGLPKRPVVIGLLGGVLPIMVAEAFAAVVLIHRREKAEVRTGATASPRTAPATAPANGRNG
mgnify:CR=1 FL=1